MKSCITIGSAMHDRYIQHRATDRLEQLDHRSYLLFKEGAKITVDTVHNAIGGGALNAAATLTQLAIDATCFVKLGTDASATFIKQHAQAKGFNCRYVETDKTCTGTSFILTSPNGNHVLFVYRAANTTLYADEIPYDLIAQQNGLYMTSLTGTSAQHVPAIAQAAHKKNAFVGINPGSQQLKEYTASIIDSLLYIDVLIVNADESRFLLGQLSKDPACIRRLAQYKETHTPYENDSPQLLQELETIDETCIDVRQYFKEILNRGPRIAIVTNGAEGVYAATEDLVLFHPSIPVTDIVSTVGAGDAFGSCFFGSLLRDIPFEKALSYGVLNSAAILQSQDTQSTLLSDEALEKAYASLDITVQRYTL